MEVLSPRSLEEALALKAEHPDAVPIAGGTDVLVAVNFDRLRPRVFLNLEEVGELRGWEADDGVVRIGARTTYTELMDGAAAEALPALAEASRTVGSPQIRNRGTVGGNLGTASPAGDALPPLLVGGATIELASVRGRRSVPLTVFLVGPKRNTLEADELIVGITVRRPRGAETFMKVGPRNAMVIAVCSLALRVDEEAGEVAAAFGSAGPTPGHVQASLADADGFADAVAEAASPIDDVRGTARYRRHALRVLARRALQRCLA